VLCNAKVSHNPTTHAVNYTFFTTAWSSICPLWCEAFT